MLPQLQPPRSQRQGDDDDLSVFHDQVPSTCLVSGTSFTAHGHAHAVPRGTARRGANLGLSPMRLLAHTLRLAPGHLSEKRLQRHSCMSLRSCFGFLNHKNLLCLRWRCGESRGCHVEGERRKGTNREVGDISDEVWHRAMIPPARTGGRERRRMCARCSMRSAR